MTLEGKVVLVTGASRGIGAATALELMMSPARIAATIRFLIALPAEASVPDVEVRAAGA
jgi:NAD(P)-dependent dehydrogenase (short-subunit alcohol dehydrogenase family)